MANTKRLIKIVALIEIDAPTDADVSVIGGNLARQLQGAIPSQYEVKGVEMESVGDVEEKPVKTANTARPRGERDEDKPTLQT